jgi:hypothetical protein
MIGRLQKTKILEKIVQGRMRAGRYPYLRDVLPAVADLLRGKRLGAPLSSIRPAVKGQPIGGVKGTDISDTFSEMREDLQLLYSSIIQLASRSIDIYDIFGVRRDRLMLKLRQLRTDIETLLAQQGAGSRLSTTETFHTSENIDLLQTTARVDLSEGTCSLPANNFSSVKYDGSKVRVTKTLLPAGGSQVGPPFQSVFSPFRLDAWYVSLPVGQVFEAHVNVTGVDYEKGGSEEVLVNALRIEPTGPMHITVDWSPDGLNWHKLNPAAEVTTRDVYTWHFDPVNLGFLRFRIRHSEEISASAQGQTRPVGLKRVEILKRGFNNTASLYSNEYQFSETINTVVMETQAETPLGTKIVPYVSLTAGGPWLQIQNGQPATFDTRVWSDLAINTVEAEQTGVPQTMWRFRVPDSQPPLPNTGDLVAGRGQVQVSAYAFDWRLQGDPYHIPDIKDWETPLAEVRTRPFAPVGVIGGVSGVTATDFTDNHNPLAVDNTDHSYIVLAIIGGDGQFALQRGYNYRLRAYAWVNAPVTQENQRIAVINTAGTANTKVAPLAVYVNGTKVYQQTVAATALSDLTSTAYQATIPLVQGFNTIELLIQIPSTLVPGQAGLASNSVFVYFQPNFFSSNLQNDLKIDYVQAYRDAWKRLSEFNLRYNTPPGLREAWAWDENLSSGLDAGKLQYILFNHDPTNSADSISAPNQSFQTMDGYNYGVPVSLFVRYPSDRNLDNPATSLFVRADLFQDPGASTPPVLRSYRILVN